MLLKILAVFSVVSSTLINTVNAADCSEAFGYVNPFIGSGGPGFGYGGLNPGAQVPYAPLRLGPDTDTTVLDARVQHFSGYFYQDDTIRAFSHNHLVGAGVNDLGVVGVMPWNVKPNHFQDVDAPVGNFSSRLWWTKFDKSTEKAEPGKYSVYLKEQAVQAELLAIGTHAAVHRYTWSNTDSSLLTAPALVLDMCHSARLAEGIRVDSFCINATIDVDESDPSRFTGSVFFRGSLSGNTVYYVYGEIATSSRLTGVKAWKTCTGFNVKSGDCSDGASDRESTTGTLFSIATLGYTGKNEGNVEGLTDFSAELRIGLSFISSEQAKTNLYASTQPNTKFNVLAARTKAEWCNALNVVSFDANEGDEEIKYMLYTAAYRTMMSPSRYTETGGLYVGLDRAVHNATADRIAQYGDHRDVNPHSYDFYSDLSLWDTFRTVHPWLLLLNEDIAIGIARSTAEMTSQQGAYPRWVMGPNEGSCMIGEHGSSLVLEAIKVGLGAQIDVATIQKALVKQSTENVPVNGRSDVEFLMANGYVRQDVDDTSTSSTLSYALDDYLLSGISEYVGDSAAASAALARSQNYRNIWSSESLLFCPKYESGELKCPSSGAAPASWGEFKEGDANHWAWYVVHDVPGLVSLFPSPEAYDAALNTFFEMSLKFNSTGSLLPNPYYWAGNEHDFMTPFMFNWGPNCTRTQYWSRKIAHLHFSNTPHGIPGNDDYGSMSSFLMFAALGIYPQAGTTNYIIGSPRVSKASITLKHFDGSSSVLNIVTHDNSAENVFVAKLLVNGVEYNSAFIDRSVLASVNGATLEFFMQSTPNSGLCA